MNAPQPMKNTPVPCAITSSQVGPVSLLWASRYMPAATAARPPSKFMKKPMDLIAHEFFGARPTPSLHARRNQGGRVAVVGEG